MKIIYSFVILITFLNSIFSVQGYNFGTYGSGCYGNSTCSTIVEEDDSTPTTTAPDDSSSGGRRRASPVVLQTEPNISYTQEILFDIRLELPRKEIEYGENLSSIISLININLPGEVKVNLTYIITDYQNVTVYKNMEEISLATQKEFIRLLPTDKLNTGEYTLLLNLSYEGQMQRAETQDTFKIIVIVDNFTRNIIILLLLIIFFILLMWYINKKRMEKRIELSKDNKKGDLKPIESKDNI